MKFSCERCGKKYATAENLAPGRVYKLRCKACGHLIVVRASAGAPAMPARIAVATEAAGVAPASAPDAPPAAPPDPGARDRAASANGASAQAFGAATTELTVASARSAVSVEEEPEPPPGGDGYVDLFADLGAPGAEAPPGDPQDPFLAAARASLPDAYGGPGAPDPLASLRQDPPGAASAARAPPFPKVPVIPKPPPQKSGLPLALIGGGVAVLVGILAFVLAGSGRKAAPAPVLEPAPAPVQAQAPVATPPAPAAPTQVEPPAPAAEAEPPPPEPARAAGGDRPRRDDRRRRDREEARAERERRAREARDAKARDARERDQKGREAAVASVQGEGGGALTEAQIEAVLRSTRKAFDGCLQGARGAEPKLDGRHVMLLLNIQPSGTVTYPTLDDVTLNGTELGSCLKSAARLMVFPRFKGDTLHVQVPVVLR